MCSEAEVRKIIGPAGAGELVDIIQFGWTKYLDRGPTKFRKTRAALVWDYMIEEADRRLLDIDGVECWEPYEEAPVYILFNRLVLGFKMHDNQLITRNASTRRQRDVANDGHFPELPNLPYLSVGYTLDSAEAGLDRLVVVRRVGGMLEWWFDLRDLADGSLTPTTPVLPNLTSPEDIASLPTIAVRRPGEEEESK